MIVKVAVRGVDKLFDYKVPLEYEGGTMVGLRVMVPFGLGNKCVEGIIVETAKTSEYKCLKKIVKLIDSVPLLTDELLNLALWMREGYFCPYYYALKSVMLPGLSTSIEEKLILTGEETDGLNKNERALFEVLKEHDGEAILKDVAGVQSVTVSAKSLFEKGILNIDRRDTQRVRPKVRRMVSLNIDRQEAEELIVSLSKRAPIQAKMIDILLQADKMASSDLAVASEGGYSAIRALEKKGMVCFSDEAVRRPAYLPENYERTRALEPTPEQIKALEKLRELNDKNEYACTLIHGVTGSGKTEVFLQFIQQLIAKGRQAIVLVPEISLTPQMTERFVGRFGDRVSVLHSSLSSGERYDEWQRILNSKVDVVIGARSAIFAPLQNIGAIIIDEEQESSYKSDSAPRYNTVEVARWRARAHNAQLILASATPSVNSYYYAQEGKYNLIEMKERYNAAKLPSVSVVDMRRELIRGNRSMFSSELAQEIQRNVENGEQTILFLNRRGYNAFVSCRSCGEAISCKNCNITLTYHKKVNRLICHYCGYSEENPQQCPECGSPYIRYFGEGTQKIEEELKRIVPGASFIRMDMDTTSNKNSHEAILGRFLKEKIDILIGTQMVTKGLDFKNVTLVGVMAADLMLNLSDYRALERSFSLMTQVCGRAGRGDKAGRAVIQTYQPEHFVIELAKEHDYINFYNDEILLRKHFENPPFCDIIIMMSVGEDEEEVKKLLLDSVGYLTGEGFSLSEPAPAPIARIKGKYRYRCIIKCKDRTSVMPQLREIMGKFAGHEDVSLIIDINPNNML